MVESMQQSSATPSLHLVFLGVAEDCCMLSTIPCSGFLYSVSTVFGTVSSLHLISFLGLATCYHATIFCNPIPTSWFLRVAEDCYMLSTLPSCICSFWHSVIPTSNFIFILLVYYTPYKCRTNAFFHGERRCPLEGSMIYTIVISKCM